MQAHKTEIENLQSLLTAKEADRDSTYQSKLEIAAELEELKVSRPVQVPVQVSSLLSYAVYYRL